MSDLNTRENELTFNAFVFNRSLVRNLEDSSIFRRGTNEVTV